MTFSSKNYRNKTLLDCLQDVIDSTGNQAWIDPYKNFRYVSPTAAQTAPFGLSNDPNFNTTFQVGIESYETDDTAAINRVYFYGGKKLSNDFIQDLSTQANGTNTTFMLAYYPSPSSDGNIYAIVNGTYYIPGRQDGGTAADKLISDGGTAVVLLNADAHTLIFNSAPTGTVQAKYRYELPLLVTLVSKPSYQFFGTYLDGTLSDSSVVDINIAVQRCKILLLEQAYGLTTIKARCWRAGLQSGMAISLYHSIRQINSVFIVQEVDTKPLGNGIFQYDITLGAWNWSMVDVLNHVISALIPEDDSTDESETPVDDEEADDQLTLTDTATATTANFGGYQAHASALGDGHDAYCGFSSITS